MTLIQNLKSEYIINQEGHKIQELSENQESILEKINKLELQRKKIIHNFIEKNNMKDVRTELTLNEIMEMLNKESACKIYETGAKLKKIVININTINKKNTMLLNDNLEFYNILMENMKEVNAKSEGYSSTGKHKTERENGSLIFNKTV